MMTPETLAAALRVTQHGARSAMLAARRPLIDDAQKGPDDGPDSAPTPTGNARQTEAHGLR